MSENYRTLDLLSFTVIADRGEAQIPQNVICRPAVIEMSIETCDTLGVTIGNELRDKDDLLKLVKTTYDVARVRLEKDDVGNWYCGHVSNLADELFEFICIVEMEGSP
jgi:hypothetical protein